MLRDYINSKISPSNRAKHTARNTQVWHSIRILFHLEPLSHTHTLRIQMRNIWVILWLQSIAHTHNRTVFIVDNIDIGLHSEKFAVYALPNTISSMREFFRVYSGFVMGWGGRWNEETRLAEEGRYLQHTRNNFFFLLLYTPKKCHPLILLNNFEVCSWIRLLLFCIATIPNILTIVNKCLRYMFCLLNGFPSISRGGFLRILGRMAEKFNYKPS